MPTPIEWIPFEERKAHTRKGPHRMSGRIKRMPWPYCVQCGLIALKNEPTQKRLRQQCQWVDD